MDFSVFDDYECEGQFSLFDYTRPTFKIDKPVRLIELFGGIGSQSMALERLCVNFEHYRLIEFDKYPVASYNAIHEPNLCVQHANMVIQINKLTEVLHGKTILEQSRAEQSRAEKSRAEQLDVCRIGNLNGFDGGSYAGQVFDLSGIAPTLTDMQGGGRQPHIVEVNKMDEIIAIDEQNKCIRDDVFGTLTTDGSSPKHNNRVGEIKKIIYDDYNGYIPQNQNCIGTITQTCGNESFRNGKKVIEMKTIKIRQATKEGFIDLELPGLADLEYPNSNTRRGRVVEGGQICPTLTTENIPSLIELADEEFWNFLYEIDGEIYLIRIRKLTPKECWSLMDFNEGAFEKAEKVNSNTQLYKQAGNSIVVNVLVAVFGQLFEGKENFYKDI